MIKLALSDIDNTLVPFGARKASETTRKAIHELQDAGVLFGPATGRDAQELARFFSMDTACFSTGILSNGKRVRVNGVTIYERCLDAEALRALARIARHDSRFFLCAYPKESNLFNPAYAVGTTDELMHVYERRFKFTGGVVDELPAGEYIGATLAVAEGVDEQALMEELRQISDAVRMVSPIPGWYDVLPTGLSKATALDVLMDYLDLAADEVVVFGDAENDLEIMRKVPYAVAVDNALDVVKREACAVIDSVSDEGVAKALHALAAAAEADVYSLPTFLKGARCD